MKCREGDGIGTNNLEIPQISLQEEVPHRSTRGRPDSSRRSVRIDSTSMSSEAPQTTRQVVETVLLDPHERQKLVGFAHNRYGISSQEAEDLLQDTALELLRQRQYVHKPRAYVYAVFRARCSRHPSLSHRSDRLPAADELVEEGSPAEEVLHSKLTVRQALGTVSSSCRKLLAAYYIQGQSLKEAAATMSLAQSGVTKTIGRCLKRLRACLKPRRHI